MVTITLKGREIPLLYTVWEMKEIQEEIAPLSQAISLVLGRNPEDKEDTSRYGGAEHLAAASKLIRILGNAGLEESGEEGDITDKWVLRHMKPAMVLIYAVGVMTVISQGNMMEAKEEKKGPVDEIKEEEDAKKPQGS